MKCDNLQRYSVDIDYVPNDDGSYMDADQVDAAIAELKQKLHDAEMRADLAEAANTEYRLDIEKIKAENERLKKELKHSEDELESYFIFEKEIKQKLRAARRALWIARAEWARTEQCYENYSFYIHRHQKTMYGGTYRPYIAWLEKWDEVERKCRAKAEEYK